VQYPVLGATVLVVNESASDNASGADNQQERLSVGAISPDIGNFLAGFALGEGSFMIVCRPRVDYRRGWKISAAFNVSQHDPVPLELFRKELGCGTIRKAGNDGWYLEVNNLTDIRSVVVPFFRRFRLIGTKATDFELFEAAVAILSRRDLGDDDYCEVLRLRELMNRGGKRRYTTERILRDYTPNPSVEKKG
jgi:LAGLIDADG endonuclease